MTVTRALARFRYDPSDSVAWETIVAFIYKPLVSYVASLLVTFRVAPGETAYDIVHDVLIAFHQRWPYSGKPIESESALQAYLKTSCKNLLIDRYRHRQNAEQFVDYLTLNFANAFAGNQELYRSIFVNEIIQLLPKSCGDLLRVYVTEQLTPAEMAELEGASPATFYSRWYRCLEKAQKIYLQRKGPVNR